MYRYCVLPFCLLFLALNSSCQPNTPVQVYAQWYHIAEKYYHLVNATEKTDSLAQYNYQKAIAYLTSQNRFIDTLVDSYLKTGILKMSAGDNENALQYFNASISAWKMGRGLPDSLLFQPYLYTGSIYYTLNELDSAIWYYKKAEDITSKYFSLSESERLYNKLGALYYETGDYRKSTHYFEKALALVQGRKPLNEFFIVNYKNNIGTALLKLGEYGAALDIFKDLLKYRTDNQDPLYSNIGTTYLEMGNYSEGLHYLRSIKLNNPDKYNTLSRAYLKGRQFDSAAIYNRLSIDYFHHKAGARKNADYGLALKYSGDINISKNKINEAIHDYQAALVQLDLDFNDSSVVQNPKGFSGYHNFSLLFDVLTAKGNAFKLLNNIQPAEENLQHALDAYNAAMLLSRQVERTYNSDESRLFLKERVNPACGEAITIALALAGKEKNRKYISAAFGFAENNKASVLQAGLQQLELTSIAGLPAELVSREKTYKSLLAKLTIQLSQVKDSTVRTALQQKIQDTELLLSAVQEKLDENPSYHQLKFDTRVMRLDSIQRTMVKNDGAIISYYYTTGQLLCFYITPKLSGVSSIALSDEFFKAITGLRKQLESPAASDRKTMNDISFTLYHFLLEPVIENIRSAKRLVIIPYNEISYIPFELLKDKKDGKLLLDKYAISYNYSANFLSANNNSGSLAYNVLAMAPFAGKSNGKTVLPLLPSSANEIEGLPGKQFTGADATKSVFESLAGNFPVIHLATHAVAGSNNSLGSYIEFYGEIKDPDTLHQLYEREIYNLDLKSAKLVILSACETGNGQLVSGEGVVSLSRAFSYAGCKSVITSLWKADDKSTAFILKRLHAYLQEGFAKDDALQKAKQDYLANRDIDDKYKTPFYWAHLLLIGDREPIRKSGFRVDVPVIVSLFLVLVGFLLYKKRNRAQ